MNPPLLDTFGDTEYSEPSLAEQQPLTASASQTLSAKSACGCGHTLAAMSGCACGCSQTLTSICGCGCGDILESCVVVVTP